MIVRIQFEGTVKSGKKKSILPDTVDIHTIDLKCGKELFDAWLSQAGIRGNSGVFHPLGENGSIKIKEIKEYVA